MEGTTCFHFLSTDGASPAWHLTPTSTWKTRTALFPRVWCGVVRDHFLATFVFLRILSYYLVLLRILTTAMIHTPGTSVACKNKAQANNTVNVNQNNAVPSP